MEGPPVLDPDELNTFYLPGEDKVAERLKKEVEAALVKFGTTPEQQELNFWLQVYDDACIRVPGNLALWAEYVRPDNLTVIQFLAVYYQSYCYRTLIANKIRSLDHGVRLLKDIVRGTRFFQTPLIKQIHAQATTSQEMFLTHQAEIFQPIVEIYDSLMYIFSIREKRQYLLDQNRPPILVHSLELRAVGSFDIREDKIRYDKDDFCIFTPCSYEEWIEHIFTRKLVTYYLQEFTYYSYEAQRIFGEAGYRSGLDISEKSLAKVLIIARRQLTQLKEQLVDGDLLMLGIWPFLVQVIVKGQIWLIPFVDAETVKPYAAMSKSYEKVTFLPEEVLPILKRYSITTLKQLQSVYGSNFKGVYIQGQPCIIDAN